MPYLVFLFCTLVVSLTSAQAQFMPPVDSGDVRKFYVNDGHATYLPFKTFSTPRVTVPSLTYAVPSQTPVKSIGKGTVKVAEYNTNKGWYVIVDHGHQITSEYHHLDTLYCTVQQKVSSETIIGLSGMSGRSTGPHLDLIVVQNGQTIDPRKLFLSDCCMHAPLDNAEVHRYTPDSTVWSSTLDLVQTGSDKRHFYAITSSTDYRVKALADGQVIRVDTAHAKGQVLIAVQHQHHLISYYCNLTIGSVQLHDTVKAGQTIGQLERGKNSFLLYWLTEYQTPIYPTPLFLWCP